MAIRCVVDCSCQSMVGRGKGATEALAAYAAGLVSFREAGMHAEAGHEMTLRFYAVDEPASATGDGGLV